VANTLSAADRIRLMELIADYAINLDGGYLDRYVDSFTPDGALTNRTGSYDGEETIRDYVGHLTEIGQVGPASGIRHFIGLPLLQGGGDACHASAYVMIPGSLDGGPIVTYLVGIYELDFVKQAGEWRFKTRHSRMDLVGPDRPAGEPVTERGFPAPPRRQDSMSAEEKIEVIDLLAGYAFLLDRGDVAGYADQFTPDGVFESGSGPVSGRAAIEELVRSIVERSKADNARGAHVMGIPSIRGDAQSCEAETYLLLLRQSDAGPIEIRAIGCYSDEIVKHEGRWRFQKRTFRPQIQAG
jgi:ketosteroid isomerase-like protein